MNDPGVIILFAMKTLSLFYSRPAGLGLVLGLLFSGAFLQAAPETYKIDPVHSSVDFKIRHLGISWVSGIFKEFEGTLIYDETNAAASTIEVMVKASSVDTNSEMRDAHLKKPEFFNVDKFPALTFKSTKVEKLPSGHLKVNGDFTLLGVTKPIEFEVEVSGPVQGMKGETRRGGETEFEIKRSDYGMKEMVGPIGDEAKISLAFSAIKQ